MELAMVVEVVEVTADKPTNDHARSERGIDGIYFHGWGQPPVYTLKHVTRAGVTLGMHSLLNSVHPFIHSSTRSFTRLFTIYAVSSRRGVESQR